MEALFLHSSRAVILASGLCIIFSIVFIKTGHKDYHKKAMLLASFLAVIFVILYITRTSLYPIERYAGANRGLYLSVLWSYTVLSLVNLPLAVITVYLAFKGRFARHKRIAPVYGGCVDICSGLRMDHLPPSQLGRGGCGG